jgi:hypothetical protein
MEKNSAPSFQRWLVRYSTLLSIFAIFSYSLTDPNLVLTSWLPYWQFQQWMWQTFFQNAPLLTYTYTALIIGIFGLYMGLVRSAPQDIVSKFGQMKSFLIIVLLTIAPLFLSYNMLSHDVFNYIFNAKMVLAYDADPHVQVALDFQQDNWTRFMHNTHTPAPYGQGWTALSLLPYAMGLSKFTFTWLIFRGWSVLSVVLTAIVIWFVAKRIHQNITYRELTLLFLNPLLVIEVVSTIHNDLWMMMPAVLSLGLIIKPLKNKTVSILISALLLFLSSSIKLASIVLLPLWIFFLFYHFSIWAKLHQGIIKMKQKKLAKLFTQYVESIRGYWAEIAVILCFIPLLTDRSQQFHPWYLTWLLVWLPFLKVKWMKGSIVVLSVSSLLRYIPWLWVGHFSDQVILQEKAITWVPLVIFLIAYGFYSLFHPHSKTKTR